MKPSSVLSSPEKIRGSLETYHTLAQELELDKLLRVTTEMTPQPMNVDRATLFRQ